MSDSLAEAKLRMTRLHLVKSQAKVQRFLFIYEETVNNVFQNCWV